MNKSVIMSNSSVKYSKSATTIQNDLKITTKEHDFNKENDSITLNLELEAKNTESEHENENENEQEYENKNEHENENEHKNENEHDIENLNATSIIPHTQTQIPPTITPTTTPTITPTTPPTITPTTAPTPTTTAPTPTTTPTTSTSLKKYFLKRPTNLSLQIANALTKTIPTATTTTTPTTKTISTNSNEKYAETENETLSNTKISMTPPSSSTSNATETTTATIFPHEQYVTMKKLDIGFKDIKFSAKASLFSKVNKDIIKGISGVFRSGELSAIVGPSGAGKSTLLNILSAYTPHGFTGDVTVNGNARDIKAFKPNLAFITQDTSLQPYLTVKEAMHFSANLKIGTHMSKGAKRERVRKILEAIGIYENRHVRTGNLSGGQKKRLAIALELVNNPPVLILDEPTSGLDSSIANQCISLLKKLAMEGRTVICTIHQPSALAFEMFDHLYAIAEGDCIYSGGTQNLVPFLADLSLVCPESYNPVDYLMEIATHDYGNQNQKLIEKSDHGHNESFRQNKSSQKTQMDAMKKINKMMASGLMTPVTAPILSPSPTTVHTNYPPSNYQNFKQLTPINEMSSKVWDGSGFLNENQQKPQNDEKDVSKAKKLKTVPIDPATLCSSENIYATPFYRQLSILLLRTFLILWRDKSLTTMRFVIHFLTAVLIGFLYYGIGNDAGNALNSYRYVFYTIMFIMYCAFSSILVNFPLEFPIVSREHFNRWYSLRAYYVAMTLADIPIQLICTSLFIGITYFLTDQPRELFRIGLFAFIVFLTALVGQSIGLAVGASLNITLGCILGPFFICPFLTFSGFFLQEKDAPVWMHWLFTSSFLKYSLDGAMLSIFGFDRPKLECHDMYCHYSRPQYFLKYLDMENADYFFSAVFLVSLFLGLRILAFYIMSFRLRLFR